MITFDRLLWFRYLTMGSLLLAGTVVAGCAAKRSPALEQARAAYAQAQSDPQITGNAAVALHEAESSLRRAEKSWENNKDEKEAAHLAYVIEKQVDTARALAEQKKAQAEAQRLNDEREQVIIAARTSEAERARRDAQARAREAEQASARAKQLEKELAALKAKQTERGLVLTLGDVLFEYNKAELKPGAMQNMYRLVSFLKENPSRNVIIEGHTDSTGSDSYNLNLSQRRAEAAQMFLLQNGIAPERITARGYGEAYPVTTNNTEAGRQQNRRVEIVILNDGETADKHMRN